LLLGNCDVQVVMAFSDNAGPHLADPHTWAAASAAGDTVLIDD
jgi:hypothetical protein